MLFNFLAFALVILVAAFLGNQGVLSAMLAFICATFASILAGSLFEPLEGIVAGYRPEYARGITFLALFFVAFTICRLAADFIVPKNIKLPKYINKSVGSAFGLLAGLVIIGSILIGIQMLPLSTSLLGYDRFGGETGMQGDGPGTVAAGSNVWLAPDRFTLALWNLASGKSLGGDRPFKSVHPDLLTESYGYRNTVYSGVTQTLPPDLLKVDSTWVSADAATLKGFNIPAPDPGKADAVVRAEITSSAEAPKISVNAASTGSSSGSFFFVTPSEVRMVTNQGHQYYPIGYLEKGRSFTKLDLDSGQLADDFPTGKNVAVEDWVFQINTDETPALFEIKQLARVPLTSIQANAVKALAGPEYPPRAYRQEQGTIHITTSGFDGMAHGMDESLRRPTSHLDRQSKISVSRRLWKHHRALQQINNSSGDWYAKAGQPGVPSRGDLDLANRSLRDFENKADDEHLNWDQFVHYLFVGKSTTDGPHNLIELPKYFEETLVPYFTPDVLLSQGVVDTSGKLDLPNLPKGTLDVIVGAKTDKGFYIWALGKEVKPKQETDIVLSPTNAGYAAVLK